MSQSTSKPSDATVPAPWDLKGRGFMFLYHFPKTWAAKANLLPEEQRGEFQGGLGALMLVDYESSNAGPYRELLFIPGKFLWNSYNRHAISRIWVSTSASVVNGRANWGIPKKRADFSITRRGQRKETWEVQGEDGHTFFAAKMRYGRLPLPMHTAMVPFPLLQWLGGQGFLTRFTGYGLGRLATLEDMTVDASVFPDISGRRPLLGLEIQPFFITFPVPEMVAQTRTSPAAPSGRAYRTAP